MTKQTIDKTWRGLSRYRHLLLAPLVALGVAGIVASGGGGGNGPPPTQFSGDVDGAAVKGIIKAGKISAEELAANGSVARSVGIATTDGNGDYTLPLSADYGGGPVLLTITADGGTSMVCDVQPDCGTRTDDIVDANGNSTVDFGEELRVADLNMTTLLPAASSGATVTTHITPFTHMAATRARAASTLNVAAVEAADSELANLFGGLDVVHLKPVNLASALADASAAEREYAALLAGVGSLAYGAGGQGLKNTVDMLANAFRDGRIGADVALADNQFSLQQITDALDDQLSRHGITDTLGLVTALRTKIADAGASGTVDPEPSPNAGNTDIAKAKALVQESRTWVRQIAASGGAFDAFGTQIDMAAAVSQPFATASGGALSSAVQLLFASSDGGDGTTNYDPWPNGKEGSGSITVSGAGTDTVTVTISGTIVNRSESVANPLVSSDIALTLSLNSLGTDTTTTANISGTVENDGVTLTISRGTVTVTFNPAPDPNDDVDMITAKMQAINLKFTAKLEQVGAANPVSFTGDSELDVVRIDTGIDDFNLSKLTMSGTVANNTDSFTATIGLTQSDPASYNPNLPESADNFAKFTLSLGLTAQVEGLPQAEVTLTVNRTGFDEAAADNFLGSGTLILAHDNVTTRVEASRVEGANLWGGTLTFTSQDGAQLIASGEENVRESPLTVNGNRVGTAADIGDGVIKISYEDGTFETLN